MHRMLLIADHFDGVIPRLNGRDIMAVVAAAITVERLVPAGERVGRAMGAAVIGAGLFLLARAAGLGQLP